MAMTLTRRSVVQAAPGLALALTSGCRRRLRDDLIVSESNLSLAGMDTKIVSTLADREHAKHAVVFLHGSGGIGSSGWRRYARFFMKADALFFVPSAPARSESDRGWWNGHASDEPVWARVVGADAAPPSPPLLLARQRVQALLREIASRYRTERMSLAGQSQGAILALDVACALDSTELERVALVAGAPLAASLTGLRSDRSHRPRFWRLSRTDGPIYPSSIWRSHPRRIASESL